LLFSFFAPSSSSSPDGVEELDFFTFSLLLTACVRALIMRWWDKVCDDECGGFGEEVVGGN